MNKGNISANLLAEYHAEIEAARQQAIQTRIDEQYDQDRMDYFYDDPFSFEDEDYLDEEYPEDHDPHDWRDDTYLEWDDQWCMDIFCPPPRTTQEHYEQIWRDCQYLTEGEKK